MSTTKLELYNGALILLGQRTLATVSEERESRRKLDVQWDLGAVDYCLKQAFWKFSLNTVKLEFDASVDPAFGHQYAFAKPDDMLRTYALCQDEYFQVPLVHYQHEGNYFYAEIDQIYLRYVSNHADYGGQMNEWSPEFVDAMVAYLAWKAAPSLNTKKVAECKKAYDQAMKEARGSDAMETPPLRRAPGSWRRSRHTSLGRENGAY